MIDAKRTGERIRFMCACKGITVKRIQEELKIGSFQSVYNWFGGRTLPTLENYFGLCRLLEVPMESLIVETTDARPDQRFCDRLVRLADVELCILAEYRDRRREEERRRTRMEEYGKRLCLPGMGAAV